MLERLLPPPRLIVPGAVGTGWLGLVVSWALLAFGVVVAAWSLGGIASTDESCASSARVCGAASIGGLVAGVVGIALAVVCSLAIARGFGPPAHWWALPGTVWTIAAGVLLAGVAGTDAVSPWPIVVGLAVAVVAIAATVAVLRRGRAAAFGWIRLDGLDAREVPMRTVELALPVAAFAVASATAAFGAHVARLLASG